MDKEKVLDKIKKCLALARRMFGCEKVEYLDNDQLHKLVAALQIAANRRKGK